MLNENGRKRPSLQQSASDSSLDTPLTQCFYEARLSGYEGTLEDYVGLHKYAKLVLASSLGDGFRVTPTKVGNFAVKPLPSYEGMGVLSDFKVGMVSSDNIHRVSSLNQGFIVSSSVIWLSQMRLRIEKELKKMGKSGIFDSRRQKEAALDAELRERRFARDQTKPALPSDAVVRIKAALGRADEDILICKFNIDFTRRDMATLRSPKWLNDEVINFYMQLIMKRSQDNPTRLPRVHVFSTFFYPKIKDRGYESVKTTTRKINPPLLTSKDLILFPIHLGMHWCMAVIDFVGRKIVYFDSLHGNNSDCHRALREWLWGESRERLGVEFDFNGWKDGTPKDIPCQQNGYDCGVFALMYAEHLSRGAPFNFSQKDMLYYRDRISIEILQGSILE